MDNRRQARLVLLLIAPGGLAIAVAAVWLAITFHDPAGALFRQVLIIPALGALLAWFALASGARRYTVGKLPRLRMNSPAALVWGGFRVALLIASVLVLVGWLGALALGVELASAFIGGFVLLAFLTVVTGLAGGAFINSALVVRHWRRA